MPNLTPDSSDSTAPAGREGASRWVRGTIAAAALLIVAFSYVRLYYGVDVTDEAFYVALPYTFAVGGRPFVTESLLMQTAGVLLTPLVALYVKVAGGTGGLMLFVRHLYLLFSILVGLVSYRALRRHTGFAAAAVAGLLPVAYVPIGIPGLGYNTLGAGFLTLGLLGFVAARAMPSGYPRTVVFVLAGLAFGSAAAAYPPLVLVLPLLAIASVALSGSKKGALAEAGLVSVGMGAAWLAWWLTAGGPSVADLLGAVRHSHAVTAATGDPRDWHKFVKLADEAVRLDLVRFQAAVAFAGVLLARFAGRRWRYLLCLLPVALVAGILERVWEPSAQFVVLSVAMWLPVVWLASGRGSWRSELFTLVWLPSVAAGLLTGYSSNGGLRSVALGLLPAAVVSLALLADPRSWAADTADASDDSRARRALPLLTGLVAVSFLVFVQYAYLYRDAPFGELTERVTDGPYAGIRTCAAKAGLMRDLVEDTREAERRGERLLFYPKLPAGYLFSSQPPAAITLWVPSSGTDALGEEYVAAYPRRVPLPDRVFRVRRLTDGKTPELEGSEAFFRNLGYAENGGHIGALDRYLEGLGYRVVQRRVVYDVYLRDPSATASNGTEPVR